MNSSRSHKPNFFQKLKSWRSNHEKSTSSCTDVVVYTGDSGLHATLCPDYYHVLGVSPSASEESIRAAYRARARLWHPDKNGGSDQSQEKFIQLQRAYVVLSNPNKRAIYDRFGAMGLDVAERCDEDQQQYMAEFARSSRWALLLMCIGLLTCCFCCYCCFGCCSMCRRSSKVEESQRRRDDRRDGAADSDYDGPVHNHPTETSHHSTVSDGFSIKIKGLG